MLPGPAAGPLLKWVLVARFIGILPAVGLGLNLGFGHDRVTGTTIVLFVLFVACIVFNLFVTRYQLGREQAETAAGYTTFRRKHLNLPQLDPRTGDVVRAAGAPYLGSAASGGA